MIILHNFFHDFGFSYLNILPQISTQEKSYSFLASFQSLQSLLQLFHTTGNLYILSSYFSQIIMLPLRWEDQNMQHPRFKHTSKMLAYSSAFSLSLFFHVFQKIPTHFWAQNLSLEAVRF